MNFFTETHINKHYQKEIGFKSNKNDEISQYQKLDINLLNNGNETNTSSFNSKLYSTHLLVAKFLKKFNKYQDAFNYDEHISNEKKFKVIEPLANAYRNLEMYFIIRIPQNKIEFVDQLITVDSNHINSRICWLGLNRFNDNCCEKCSSKIKFIQDSINTCTSTSDNNNNDKLIFIYFQLIFYQYIGDVGQLKSIINSNLSNHEIFIYYSSKLILFNNLKLDEIKTMSNTILNYISSDNCKFTTGHSKLKYIIILQ